ncbi:MAG: hypothetical protein AAB254_11145 [candidate division NC10 bacterium]
MGPDYDRIELFVPEGDRRSKTTPVDLHDRWVIRIMRTCTKLFGGATAYGRGVGAWESGKRIHWDRITVIEVWMRRSGREVQQKLDVLHEAMMAMGRALHQKAVACTIGPELYVIDCEVER